MGRKKFIEPAHFEHAFAESPGSKIGTLRIKTSHILWKPANSGKFYSVPLEKFVDWIMDPSTEARIQDR